MTSALDGHRPAGNNKGRRFDPTFYEPRQVEQILGQCSRTAPTGIRDAALLAVTWRAALRANCEALALNPGDLDGSTVRVLHGKGDKARNVQVSAGCLALIDHWLGVRSELGLGKSDPLFCTLEGRRMSYPAFDAMFKRRAAKSVGPDFRWHLHALRASRAIELERAGTLLSVISAFLGHASVAETDTYLRKLHRTAEVEAAGDDGWSL